MIRNRQYRVSASRIAVILLAMAWTEAIVSPHARADESSPTAAFDATGLSQFPIALDTQRAPEGSSAVVGATAAPTILPSSGPSVIPATSPADQQLKAPPASVDLRAYGVYGFANTWNGDANVQIDRAGTALDVAVPLALPLRFDMSVVGEFSHYGFSDGGAVLPESNFAIDGYAVAIQPGLGLALSPQFAVFAGPTFQSTAQFGANFQRSLTYGGDVGVYYKVDSKLSASIGVGASSRLSHAAYFYPVIGLDWQLNDDWRCTVQTLDFGANARLTRRLISDVSISLLGGYAQREYRLGGDSPEPGGLLRDFYVPIGLELAYVRDTGPTIRLDVGTSIIDNIRFDDSSGNKVARHDAHPTPFVGLTASWKI